MGAGVLCPVLSSVIYCRLDYVADRVNRSERSHTGSVLVRSPLTAGTSYWNRIMAVLQEQLDRAIVLAKAYGATRLILFGSAVTAPEQANDLDLACDGVTGWELYELGARLEEELRIPLDLVPLSPPTRFTRLIEHRGKVLL